ncbi:NAD-dependent epimerase/dehydratase family protein [Brevibacillus sp. H7]|uniref:NAD-dependent epimerase/dehydratase family protein n=1 Tax=Brevibacillus sp. H7 TaxID=3349138 RepID=UPI0037F208C4
MKSALIMGGTQFFGKRLVENLLGAGMDVTIATRGRTPDPFGDRVNRLIIDREHRETLEAAFDGKQWDVVYDQTCYSPSEALDTLEILKGKAGRYIFTSTMAVYDFGRRKVEADFDPYRYPTDKIGTRREYPGLMGYQEAKRTAEALLFQRADFPVVAVRFPIVIGPDDFTNRLRFHVEHVEKGLEMGVGNPDHSIGFISSEDAGRTLSWLADRTYVGPVNASSLGDLTMGELIALIEDVVGKQAIVAAQAAEPQHQSPYAMPGSWSLDSSKIAAAGFQASRLMAWLPGLLKSYVSNGN